MSIADAERAALIDLLEELGPDAPTLCAGWQTRDLAAHLIVRERRLDAAPGVLLKPLAGLTDRAMRQYATMPWPKVVGLLREGPPRWSPFSIGAVSARVNLGEFFVHHEDVRRGRSGWQPREPHAHRDAALFKLLRTGGRVLYRNSPVGIVARRPDGTEHTARAARPGQRSVVIIGEPGELVLHAFGRDAVRVEFEGDPADVRALAATRRGI
ncbi:MAG TPA: TIGR03085 family metal-binding protein [Pseudonocardiaceae bacterium]|nr:TIGR03085 family metal-binding protein [Pseudonocardiaceae bacterium]